jgi:hypothetical protein
LLEGDEYSDADYAYEYYDSDYPPSYTATLTVPASYFSCARCHLVLDYDLLEHAGVDESFQVVDEDPPIEEEYGND